MKPEMRTKSLFDELEAVKSECPDCIDSANTAHESEKAELRATISILQSRIDRAVNRIDEWRAEDDYTRQGYRRTLEDVRAILKEE